MVSQEVLTNIILILISYSYIVFIILIADRLVYWIKLTKKSSRKFIHIMMGNFIFIAPYFTSNVYSVLVAAPLIVITYFATPYSPSQAISRRLKKLVDITEEGHEIGLVLYTISYTVLAFFFTTKPYIMAAGIIPMAYGDSTASIIGERFGKRKYKIITEKSLEGSMAMFGASLISLLLSLQYFSSYYSFSVIGILIPILMVSLIVALIESISPMGVDNITVPIIGAITFLYLVGGL